MIIKVLLIGSVLLIGAWLLRGQRRAGRLALTRLAGLLLAAGWVAAVIFPDSVSVVAGWLGVGRGADLVLYVTVVAFMFTSVLHQRRLRECEARIATLTRAGSLLEQLLVDSAQPSLQPSIQPSLLAGPDQTLEPTGARRG
jgi:small membrane protein